jgi:hypothetical protein
MNQDRPPNFRVNGQLYLVRCFACSPDGRENYLSNVATGQCTWCGWYEDTSLEPSASPPNSQEPV